MSPWKAVARVTGEKRRGSIQMKLPEDGKKVRQDFPGGGGGIPLGPRKGRVLGFRQKVFGKESKIPTLTKEKKIHRERRQTSSFPGGGGGARLFGEGGDPHHEKGLRCSLLS